MLAQDMLSGSVISCGEVLFIVHAIEYDGVEESMVLSLVP